MEINDIIYKILNFFGWIWYFIKKPFKWFAKLNWKAKAFVIILILLIFDTLRFWLFSFLIWILI